MRYFIELSYDGSPFHGWQRQPNVASVQESLENALSTILRAPIDVTGAGRTDTGVHARRMYAHFDTQNPITDQDSVMRSLNRIAGNKIAVSRIFRVADDFHARFDAMERVYKYFVIFEKCPFLNQSAWLSPGGLDVDKMNEAALMLLETDDFTSFSKLHTDVKTNICDVRSARWQKFNNIYDVDGIVFTISADRFLRNMVRAIVGTLVDVGRHKISVGEFEDVIRKADRCSAGMSMPAHGLFLWNVDYDWSRGLIS